MIVRPCTAGDEAEWLRLRQALWRDEEDQHLAEMRAMLESTARYAQFLAHAPEGRALGLVEASLRTDYVNGTSSTPVAFVEGIYVEPSHRRQGIARRLVETVADWAVGRGCRELASDAAVENVVSHSFHRGLGFEEAERVVFFRKALR